MKVGRQLLTLILTDSDCRERGRVRLTSLPPEERPRERLQSLGPRSLAEAELLALILGVGGVGESALDLGRRLVAEGRGLRRLAGRQWSDWIAEPGIGPALAARLAATFELARRVRAPAPRAGRTIRSPQDVARYLAARWGDEQVECFGIVLLDARNRLVREQLLSRGGWSASVVRPREVFRQALVAGAPSIILFHNQDA